MKYAAPHWLLLGAVALSLLVDASAANPTARRRFGFEGFGGLYRGGYNIVTRDENLSGEATIRIRAPRNGRSATVVWTNTFYTEHGSYRVTLRWRFLPDGTATFNSLDPRKINAPGRGAFRLNRQHPVKFGADGNTAPLRATGVLKQVGGGAMSISATVAGLPEGVMTYSFSGGRVR